jgi:hypothetical protein
VGGSKAGWSISGWSIPRRMHPARGVRTRACFAVLYFGDANKGC